jgi:hypothetical protein
MNINIIENFDDPPTEPPTLGNYYNLPNTGENLVILSNTARTFIDEELEEHLPLGLTERNNVFGSESYFGIDANANIPNEHEVYSVYDFNIGDENVNRIISFLNGTYTLNINETINLFGNLHNGQTSGNIRCTEMLNNKTKLLTSWVLSTNNTFSESKNAISRYNQELRSRCKESLCLYNHYNIFSKTTSIDSNQANDYVESAKNYSNEYWDERSNESDYDLAGGAGIIYFGSNGINFNDKIALNNNQWVPGFIVDDTCLGSGFKDEVNISKSAPNPNTIRDIPLYSNNQDPYNAPNRESISWYIDFSNCLISFINISGKSGIIAFHENMDTNSSKVFYVDYYIIDADTGSDAALYAILHRAPNQRFYKSQSNIRSSVHESCVVKITLDRQNNLVFEDNLLFPNIVIQRSNLILGCNHTPRQNSFLAFKSLLFSLGFKKLNAIKSRLGNRFTAIDISNNPDIEIEIIRYMSNIYDMLIDYIPSAPPASECQGYENSEEDGEDGEDGEEGEEENGEEGEEENENNNLSAEDLIRNFLYESCDGKSLDQQPESSGKFNVFARIFRENNRKNLVSGIYNLIKDSELNTINFCQNTGLGTITPNDFLKNAGILHSMFLGVTSMTIPKIRGEDSEDEFRYITTNDTCEENSTNIFHLLSYPDDQEIKNCDQRNFRNNNEILNKCNLENKNLLTEVCKSYGAPLDQVGNQFNCSISNLNSMTDRCDRDINPDCSSNPNEMGCNAISPESNQDIVTYPNNYPIRDSSPAHLGGACSTFNLNNLDIIDAQNQANEQTLNEAQSIRDILMSNASQINNSHVALSTSHQNRLKQLEEIAEDTTRMRICNAQKRKYDFENKVCTNEFLQLINADDYIDEDYRSCEQDRENKELEIKSKLYLYFFVFLILFFIFVYFIFLR